MKVKVNHPREVYTFLMYFTLKAQIQQVDNFQTTNDKI